MIGCPFSEEQAAALRAKYGIPTSIRYPLRKPLHKTASYADIVDECGCDGSDDGYTPTKCPYCREREEAGHE